MESKGVVVRYIDFLILFIPTTLVSALFAASIHKIKKVFRSLLCTLLLYMQL